MARLVNEYWDDLDRDPSDEGLQFARDYLGHDHSPRCHAVQSLAVFYDKFKERRSDEPR